MEGKREVKVLASELCLADTGSLPPPAAPGCIQPSKHVAPGCKTRSDTRGLEGRGRGRVSPQGSTCLCKDSNDICMTPTVCRLLPSQDGSEFSMESRANSGAPSPLLRWLSEEEGKRDFRSSLQPVREPGPTELGPSIWTPSRSEPKCSAL